MASAKTQDEYLAAGLRFLARARKRFGGQSDIEILCAHAEARTEVLKGRTVNLYRQQYGAAVKHLAAIQGHTQIEVDIYLARIDVALAKVRGRPAKPNTASKKVKNAQDWMVRAVFGRLKQQALHHDRIRLAACALYCLLQPILGTRPIELQHARIEDDALVVQNAKRADGSSRRLDLAGVHAVHRMALLVVIEIIRVEVASVGYERWLSALAETLARACAAVSTDRNPIPRLAPSSFRHTAISTWAAAGFSVEEIAEMAGHLSLLSARRNYIHEGAGWAVKNGAGIRPAVIPPEVAEVEPPVVNDVLIVDDFPVPPARPGRTAPNTLWQQHSSAQTAEFDRIARLVRERQASEAPAADHLSEDQRRGSRDR